MAAEKVFLSFADSRYAAALSRIQKQAKALGVYDRVVTMSERDLQPNFARQHQDLLRPDIRGFGYWIWKPFIIAQLLDELVDGAVVHYADAGCHLNPRGIARLYEYFNHAFESESGLTAFQARTPGPPLEHDGRALPHYVDEAWTKGDLIDRLGVRHRPDILKTPTIGAGILFVRKGSLGEEGVREWSRICSEDNQLIDDAPSLSPNEAAFVEHRHDQAVFSLLVKLRRFPTYSAFEYFYPRRNSTKPDWGALSNFPVHARRDLGRVTYPEGLSRRSPLLPRKMLMRARRLFSWLQGKSSGRLFVLRGLARQPGAVIRVFPPEP